MDVSSLKAEGEFVGNGLADESGAGGKHCRDTGGGARRWFLRGEPVRVATAGAASLYVDQILDRERQTVERAHSGRRKAAPGVGNECTEICGRLRYRKCLHLSEPPPQQSI